MNATNEVIRSVSIATIIKPCPFCSGRGYVTKAPGRSKFGARCDGCQASFPEMFETPETAITAWCQRRGTVSSAGGRGTRGKCSWKKRRSCRRNLRIARKQKKLKWIRCRVDVLASQLKVYRAIERAELEAEAARGRAELMILEPLIRQFPDLSKMLDWLKDRWQWAEGGDPHHNDSPQPGLQNSVLPAKTS